MTNRLAWSALVCAVLAVGCGRARAPSDAPPIAALHATKCGACHSPVEPGTHTRAALESAFARHQRRVRLSDDEWNAMVQYLASDASASDTRSAQ